MQIEALFCQNCSHKFETKAELESARSTLLQVLNLIEHKYTIEIADEQVCLQYEQQAPELTSIYKGSWEQYQTQFADASITAVITSGLPLKFSTSSSESQHKTSVSALQHQPLTTKEIMNEYLLGFFAHLVTVKGTYYGGLLVTNTKGVPKEFRHSDGIQPTRVQILLYGDCLESSLGSDTLAPVLYNSLPQKPHVLLIDQTSRELFGSFIHRHQPAGMLLETSNSSQKISSEGPMLEARQIECKGAKTQLGLYLEEDPKNAQGLMALTAAQKSMNLLTPFDRIRTVLLELAEYELTHKKA